MRLSHGTARTAAEALGAPYQSVFDVATWNEERMLPAFTPYRPPRPLR
jgi:hypothetical protein